MSELTQAKLKEALTYDPDTGIFTRKSNQKCKLKLGDAGRRNRTYIKINVLGRSYQAHRLAWLYMEGCMPKNINIDHIDRDKSNNRFNNLRLSNQQCNSRNCGNWKNNSSGVKGVSWHETAAKWQGIIAINKKNKNLGLYESFHNAVCARLIAEQCLEWEGCDISSPAYQYVQKMLGN